MPYFKVPLKDNRFIIQSVVLDIRSLSPEEIKTHVKDANFEGESRSVASALIDTGATHCSITEDLAERLHLKPTGRCAVNTAGHPIECNQYFILLGIPISEVQEIRKIYSERGDRQKIVPHIVDHFKVHISQVSSLPKQEGVRDFDVIIGMDLLGKMIFHYSGNPTYPTGEMTIGF